MNFEEHAAKPLLETAGIAVPKRRLVTSAEEASSAAKELGACVIKAQVPAGKRGKAGGIAMADTPETAATAARAQSWSWSGVPPLTPAAPTMSGASKTGIPPPTAMTLPWVETIKL